MNDNKSFETVELFKPIELTSIDGIEGPKPIEEPKLIAEPIEMKPVAEPKPVIAPIESKPVVEPQKTEVKKKQSFMDKLYKGDYVQDEFDRDGFNQGGFDQSGFDQGGFDQNSNTNNSRNAAGIDLSYFYSNAGEEKVKQARDRKKREVYVVAAMFFLMFIVAAIAFKNGSSRRNKEKSINNPVQNTVQKEVGTNDYARQDEIYGIMDYDPTGSQATEFFDISHDVIEYTGPYERVLYFEYTPKLDNKVLMIEVEMVDRYGNSLGTVTAYKKNVPMGEKAIIDIPFSINQFTELPGITYNIRAEGYTLQTPEGDKNIPGMEQTDDILSVSIDGGLNVSKDAFLVLYKNGRVVSVMYGTPGYNNNGKAIFFLGDIDYDNFEVFY